LKPRILFAIPDGRLKAHMFTEDWLDRLQRFADVRFNGLSRDFKSEELASCATDCWGIVTGWGSPKLTDPVFSAAPSLRIVAHCAGTVRWLVPESFFHRGVLLVNANRALARSVGEYCLMTALMARWRMPSSLQRVRSGGWQDNNDVVPGLNGCAVGLIGYGAIAQAFIELLRPFDVKIFVCSEHLPEEALREGRVERCDLERALRCDLVSIHKTLTEKTRGLIGRRELSMIPDGGILMNTSRGAIVDEAALLEELKSGRIHAVLDVFEREPLPADASLRAMNNAIVTPHSAGTSAYWRRQMAEQVLGDLMRVYAGEEPVGRVTRAQYLSMTPA